MVIKAKIAVVIPNWNGRDFIGEALYSLQKQSVPADIIVVDNGSRDGSQQYVRSSFPKVKLIELDHNYGFAGGVNRGIEYALANGYGAIALFNNDAAAAPDWLENLAAALNKHPGAGIVTGKLLQHPDRNIIDSAGDQYSIWGIPSPRGRDEPDRGQFDQPGQVFAGSGGASLYRAELFEKVGLFDEDFFAYYEDVDLAFRARLAGWQVWYEPTARVYHRMGATSAKLGPFIFYQTIKNRYFLYLKNMPAWLFWKYLPRFLVGIGYLWLVTFKNLRFGTWLKAHGTFLLKLPAMLVKRWRVQKHRALSQRQVDELLERSLPQTAKGRRLMKFFRRG